MKNLFAKDILNSDVRNLKKKLSKHIDEVKDDIDMSLSARWTLDGQSVADYYRALAKLQNDYRKGLMALHKQIEKDEMKELEKQYGTLIRKGEALCDTIPTTGVKSQAGQPT